MRESVCRFAPTGETRNNWVHDPWWKKIAEAHEVIVELLADAMIEFHTTTFCGIDETMMRRVLKWGIETEDKRSEVEEALELISEL